uniref:Uncharacterized protein n=1 Tax=Magallana gigas TaxID=29159 RepID=A0A8W8N4X7_MAGGI
MIVFQVSDVFKSKTSSHRVVRLDQGGGVAIKLWGSKSFLYPAVRSSIEATCLQNEDEITRTLHIVQEFFIYTCTT